MSIIKSRTILLHLGLWVLRLVAAPACLTFLKAGGPLKAVANCLLLFHCYVLVVLVCFEILDTSVTRLEVDLLRTSWRRFLVGEGCSILLLNFLA